MLQKILHFLTEIGIQYTFESLPMATILPGITLKNGTLVIDKDRLLYIGDVLHEAGHLACMPPEIRQNMDADLPDIDLHRGGEMMAIAWSYAAAKHLVIPLELVFHETGYKGEAKHLINIFESGQGVGVSLLQWNKMCYQTPQNQTPSFPYMLSWTCTHNNYH